MGFDLHGMNPVIRKGKDPKHQRTYGNCQKKKDKNTLRKSGLLRIIILEYILGTTVGGGGLYGITHTTNAMTY